MNWSRPAWWPHLRRGRLSREPGAALFQGLRVRLTLWYCGVLAAALILFGVALYLGTQYLLITPVATDAQAHANVHEQEWWGGGPLQACPLYNQQGPVAPFSGGGQGFQMPEQVVCFDAHGSLLPGQNTSQLPSVFLSNTLVKTALQTGRPASNTVDAGGSNGQIYRLAVDVPNPNGNGYLGVLLIGESVKEQEAALSSLLDLLLGVGALALIGAGVGGLFLSRRARAPARLPWPNLQRFTADPPHQLRPPFPLLRADAVVLLRGRKRLDEDDAALLEDIVAEANHMSNLASNLLTLARLDSGTIHREHEVINLAELVHEGARRVQALAEQRGVSVQVESRGDTYVIGDPVLLEQAMLALLDNAIKYNRQGGRVIARTGEREGYAFLEVSDTGIGITAEHVPHLGERFYRVDKARSREAGGTGIGLSIAQRIARTHEGQITLSSVPEQGTTVTIALPSVHEDVPDDLKISDVPLSEKPL